MKKLIAIICVALIVSTAVIPVNAEGADESDGAGESVQWGDSVTVGDFTISARLGEDLDAGDYSYDNSSKELTILGDKSMMISGNSISDRIVVNSPDGANITLSNISITNSSKAAFEIAGGGTVTVILVGNNTLTSGPNCAGLQNNNVPLFIQGGGNLTATGGSLNFNGGAGIGGGSGKDGTNITINGSGTIEANGGVGGAGIGGGSNGSGTNITINGSGTVNATGGNRAAGIGGGAGGQGENITIGKRAETDVEFIGKVVANGGSDDNGYGQRSNGGAGIGGGHGGSGTDITINGSGTVNAKGGNGGAGIGGGQGGNGDTINISGSGTVEATGDGNPEANAAGIGGGAGKRNVTGGVGENIIINLSSGGKVTAHGGSSVGNGWNPAMGGAGIGGGGGGTDNGALGGGNGKNITISGSGTVEAQGSKTGGAGIGGGGAWDGASGGNGENIIIYGGNVTATGGSSSAGIGGGGGGTGGAGAEKGKGSRGEVTIFGGNVTATGSAGIGGGGLNDGTNSIVNIRGKSSDSYPWVFTSEIKSNNGDDDYWGIVFDNAHKKTYTDVVGDTGNTYAADGVVYGEVDLSALTEAYTLESGKLLRVHTGAIFKTANNLKLQGTLYLEADSTLDKYDEIEIDGGEILHADKSDYIKDSSGEWICDICGKKHEHKWTDWEDVNDNIHRRTCENQQDCSVFRYAFPYNAPDDGEHDYDFDNPTEDNPKIENGKLIYHCKLCGHVYTVDIPIINLTKVDGETKEPLAGAEFGLYSDEQCTNEKLIATGTTEIDNGKAVVSFAAEQLKKTYYIKEIKAPDGYEVSDEVYKAVVGVDGKVTYGTVGSEDADSEDAGSETTPEDIPVCKNHKITVQIIKVDGETGAALAGAEFGLYSDEQCTNENRIAIGTTKIDDDSASNTYNKAVISFDAEANKTYYIKETKAPDGYEVSDEVYKAVVDADGKVTYGTVGSEDTDSEDADSETTSKTVLVCKNYAVEVVVITGTAKIIKVDGETGAALTGAEFGLYSDEQCTDANRIATGTTKIDDDSASNTYNKAVVSFIIEANKTYYIKETKAPDGYEVSDEVYMAVVDADGKVTYGVAGSEDTFVPVCKNKKTAEADTSVPEDTPPEDTPPEDTPSEDTSSEDTSPDEARSPEITRSPETGGTEVFGTAGIAILSGIACAASLVGRVQKKRRKNSDDDVADFSSM